MPLVLIDQVKYSYNLNINYINAVAAQDFDVMLFRHQLESSTSTISSTQLIQDETTTA